MGGIDLDLSVASLDPAGARIDVKTMMGGAKITVPDDWAVRIDKSALAGGVEAKTTAPEDPGGHCWGSRRLNVSGL